MAFPPVPRSGCPPGLTLLDAGCRASTLLGGSLAAAASWGGCQPSVNSGTYVWTSPWGHSLLDVVIKHMISSGILLGKSGAVQVPPGDVPGVSQGLPEPVLLLGDLLRQQLDTGGRQQRHHDGHGQAHGRVRGHLGRGGTPRQTRPQDTDESIQRCPLTNASVEKKK